MLLENFTNIRTYYRRLAYSHNSQLLLFVKIIELIMKHYGILIKSFKFCCW